MTMWTSVDAINAEIEYRRERVQLTSRTRTGRKRRAARKQQQAVAAERRQAQQVEHATAEREGRQEHEVTLPAQRTSRSTTSQPV